MRLLAVVLLVASCKSKTAPPIGEIDRSCKADADCTLTGDLSCCGTSCGRDMGTSVNAKAWSKVSDSYRADCKGDCHVMCAKLPDCRDESFAVCKSGRCETATRKTAACAAVAIDACESAADCQLVTEGDDCCDTCGRAMTKAAAAKFLAEDRGCKTRDVNCKKLDCAKLAVDCVDKRCVTK